MKILFTGATGVLGRATLPQLTAAGHEVDAVSRGEEAATWLGSVGARPTTLDLFDAEAIDQAVRGIDVIVHFATAIPPTQAMARRDAWETNDRLRERATGLLVDAAIANGAQRFIQESITFFYADGGDEWIYEDSPTSPVWGVLDSALAAEAEVERFRVAGGTGTTMRLSRLYGPGRASAGLVAAVAARKAPVLGRGSNYVSSLHVDDAASALLAALTAADGIYNVTDDEPVTADRYMTSLAQAVDAPRPRHMPGWLTRLALRGATGLLTVSHRVSNRRFRDATGWAPRFPMVVDGWSTVVSGER